MQKLGLTITIYSKDRKRPHRENLFNYEHVVVESKYFSVDVAWSLTCAVWRLRFTNGQLDMLIGVAWNVESQLIRLEAPN